MPSRSNTSASTSPASTVSLAGKTSVAPRTNVVTISDTQASKLNDANCNTRLSASISNPAICACARLPTPRCATITPFGWPVEPDV
ncbi:hypothetical protein [Noviherbaspirillum sp. Root189]|uniref:hypothetical protein n=1 Tax=Noviherbaspirillum sp. Root189 TaxID=1736487 RepID=UPI001F1FFC71|nr:hypothetical protein [Noviherbaspirillum sp. Root189]